MLTRSSIAQWWSIRLLIEGFLVRVQVEEPNRIAPVQADGGYLIINHNHFSGLPSKKRKGESRAGDSHPSAFFINRWHKYGTKLAQ